MIKPKFVTKKNAAVSVLVILALALGTGLITYITKGHNAKDSQVITTKHNEVKVNAEKTDKEDQNKNTVQAQPSSTENSSQNNAANSNTQTTNLNTVPVKPAQPKVKPKTSDDTTNKDKVPAYSEKETSPQTTEPSAGETNSKGQIYIPGFGWTDNQGGGSQGTNVTSDGDINKQVGTMD